MARIASRCLEVRVQVLFQGMRRPDRDERFLFRDRGRARVLVREAFLYCGRGGSLFGLHDSPILVTEVFLPAILGMP
jgi:chorismate-pyruvate lyase